MFSKSVGTALKYTRPVVGALRNVGGGVEAFFGTFIVLNKDGWVLTAAHIMRPAVLLEQQRSRVQEVQRELESIRASSFSAKHKKKAIDSLLGQPLVTHVTYLFGACRAQNLTVHINHLADIALTRVTGLEAEAVSEYPVFVESDSPPRPGTMLCRVGFAFHELTARFNEGQDKFEFEDGPFPVPVFCNEGMVTRHITRQGQGEEALFFETSSPGLRGQSGGPVLDVDGAVCGMQSQTATLDLGFIGAVKGSPQERQFLNVGHVVDASEVLRFAREYGVELQVARKGHQCHHQGDTARLEKR